MTAGECGGDDRPHVWVVGAGALGVLYADTLASCLAVTLVSRRREWLATLANGYAVRGCTSREAAPPVFGLAVADELATVPPPTAVLVVASGNDGPYVQRVVAETPEATPVLSLQNGLGPQEALRSSFEDRFAYGATYQSASVSRACSNVLIDHWHVGKTVAGRCRSPAADERLDSIADQVADPRAPWQRYEEAAARSEVWTKSALAAAMSPLATLVDREVGAIDDERLRWIADSVLQEVDSLAHAVGVGFDITALQRTLSDFLARSPGAIASMTEHARAGRPLEATAITGSFLALAEQTETPMPVTRTLHALVTYGRTA